MKKTNLQKGKSVSEHPRANVVGWSGIEAIEEVLRVLRKVSDQDLWFLGMLRDPSIVVLRPPSPPHQFFINSIFDLPLEAQPLFEFRGPDFLATILLKWETFLKKIGRRIKGPGRGKIELVDLHFTISNRRKGEAGEVIISGGFCTEYKSPGSTIITDELAFYKSLVAGKFIEFPCCVRFTTTFDRPQKPIYNPELAILEGLYGNKADAQDIEEIKKLSKALIELGVVVPDPKTKYTVPQTDAKTLVWLAQEIREGQHIDALRCMIRRCPYCGKIFKPKRDDQKYCSGTCRSMSYQKRKEQEKKRND